MFCQNVKISDVLPLIRRICLIDRKFVARNQAEIILASILVLSAFLNLWNIWNQGITDSYYAAAVKSMLINPRIAFFNPFDPAGFITVDKPPIGLWIQAIFAAILGFSGWVLVLPQALAGIGSVALIYLIVARPFGKTAGLIAALALSITPIFVAVSRSGIMDAQLIFIILLAVWVALKATREHSLLWLLVSVVLIGIGFNIKMIQSFIVVPVVFMVYFLGTTDLSVRKRIIHLIIAVLVLLAVSLSWAVAVDMIPADQRPYIGGSEDNTVLNLIINYNGLERFEANRGIFGNYYVVGTPDITRLGGEHLAGQFSWLLPLALISLLLWVGNPSYSSLKWFEIGGITDERTLTIIAMLLWLMPGLLFFSFTPVFYAYYLATIAPPLAGLVGIGVITLYQEYLAGGWKGWFLVGTVLVTGLLQALFLSYDATWSGLLIPLVMFVTIGCTGILAYLRMRKFPFSRNHQKHLIIISLGLLFIAPFVWSCTVPVYGFENSLQPTAGPRESRVGNDTWWQGFNSTYGLEYDISTQQLTQFLLTHNTNETWILAVPNYMDHLYAADLIIDTGRPVMLLNGASGSDQIVNESSLAALIREGKVRYFLRWLISDRFLCGTSPLDSENFRWLITHCTALNLNNGNVTVVNWTSDAASLYDCAKA
jgi:4-amino-4-deoxy-L-arabinose transferase-like glycosyltransferase